MDFFAAIFFAGASTPSDDSEDHGASPQDVSRALPQGAPSSYEHNVTTQSFCIVA